MAGDRPVAMILLGEGPIPEDFCVPEARLFDDWCAQLLEQLRDPKTRIEEVRVAKLLLQDKWWDVRCSVEAAHRVHLVGDNGGRCVTGVYVVRFEEVMELAARIGPPSLRRETRTGRASRSRPSAIYGIPLGSGDGDGGRNG